MAEADRSLPPPSYNALEAGDYAVVTGSPATKLRVVTNADLDAISGRLAEEPHAVSLKDLGSATKRVELPGVHLEQVRLAGRAVVVGHNRHGSGGRVETHSREGNVATLV